MHASFAFYDIDLNDEARLDRVFNDMISKRSIDYLIHFAAVAFVAESYSNPILCVLLRGLPAPPPCAHAPHAPLFRS